MELLNIIKKAAIDAVKEAQPCNVLFGKVTNTSPLQININQKLILTSDFLVLTKNVQDYEVDISVSYETENKELNANHNHNLTGSVSVNSVSSVPITNTVTNTMAVAQKNIDLTHNHKVSGKKKIIIHNGLRVGEEVIVLKAQGGQKYIVLDRLTSPLTEGEWV